MTDRDNIPTLPRPAPLPREEAPTPIPRRSSLEELRASPEPTAWLEAIDALEGRLMAAIGAVAARGEAEASRSSQTDNEQQEKINELERWKKKLEEDAAKAATKSEEAAKLSGNIVTALDTLAAKWLTPQTVAVAISTFVTVGAGIVATYLKSRGMIP